MMAARGKKRLRSGFTTGACAAAASRAAYEFMHCGSAPLTVNIPFPAGGDRHCFNVIGVTRFLTGGGITKYRAAIIKDAGDDPDVTNGAEIRATIWETDAIGPEMVPLPSSRIILAAGAGVGRVSKPGLAVAVGEPAINPVPRQMIQAALQEAGIGVGNTGQKLIVEITIPDGEKLAEKTLNHRLGIVGGLSILGTTGIVRPISAGAWTATITASMSVARAAGLEEVILATGRTSEKGAFALLRHLPEEAGVMMGDYLEFSLKEAAAHGFRKIHLAGMWAKILKAAMAIPQTHVRHGALEVAQAVELLKELGLPPHEALALSDCNTAREIMTRLQAMGRQKIIAAVCTRAREYAVRVSGLDVCVYLVASGGRVTGVR